MNIRRLRVSVFWIKYFKWFRFCKVVSKRLNSYYNILSLFFQKTSSLQIIKAQYYRFCILQLLIKKSNNFTVLMYCWIFIFVDVTLTRLFALSNVFFRIFKIWRMNFCKLSVFRYLIEYTSHLIEYCSLRFGFFSPKDKIIKVVRL